MRGLPSEGHQSTQLDIGKPELDVCFTHAGDEEQTQELGRERSIEAFT